LVSDSAASAKVKPQSASAQKEKTFGIPKESRSPRSNPSMNMAYRPSFSTLVPLALLLSIGMIQGLCGQTIPKNTADQPLLFESTPAAKILEKVRSNSSGTIVEMFVKLGDPVKKGQILGHTELNTTKLQYDLAKQSFESEAAIDAAKGHAEAWTINREETAIAVRRRKAEESRLDWASAMERMYKATYETQLELKKTQQIQYEYWKREYENRFFVAPVDGIISEVLLDIGKNVTFATHVFTISDEHAYSLPISVPAPLAATVTLNDKLPIRSTADHSVASGKVDSITDDPSLVGMKIIRLLIQAADFPPAIRSQLKGKKFDVLLPEMASRREP